MHDFCLTIPYGLILVMGGLFGYVKSGSVISGAVGGGSGLFLLMIGKLSLDQYHSNKTLPVEKQVFRMSYVALQLLVALGVLAVMGHRYNETGKFMPAGMVAVMSFIMALFYLSKVFSKPTVTPQKTRAD